MRSRLFPLPIRVVVVKGGCVGDAGKGLSVGKRLPLPRRVHVRFENPLDVGHVFRVQSPQDDLVELELEPRAGLLQLDVPSFLQLVDVMAEGDVVAVVDEGDDPARVFLRHGEQVLEDGHGPLAQFRREIVEDQVGIGFRHGTHV